MELRRLRTKEGTTILAAAVVYDVLGILILILTIIISLLREGSIHYDAIIEILIEVAGFLAVSYIWIRFWQKKLLKRFLA